MCGTEIPKNSKFCLECGEKIEIADIEQIEEDYIASEIEDDINSENIEDYNETKYDLHFKTKLRILASNKMTLFIILIFLIICIVSGVFFINSSINYSKGIEAINSGDYGKAVEYLGNSDKSGSNNMIDMVNDYEDALLDYEHKLYKNVYDKLSLIDEDFPKYNECQKLINESKKYLIQEKLQEA